jgi:hypothetical protein
MRAGALPPRSARTSRGSVVHHLPGGIWLRESAGSIELLGEPQDDALEQLVNVAKQRFGTKQVTLLGTRSAQIGWHNSQRSEDCTLRGSVSAEKRSLKRPINRFW